MEIKTTRTKARLIVLAVFLMGFAAGILSMSLYQRATGSGPHYEDRKPPQDHLLEKMSKRLNLSPEQKEQIRAILEETFQKYSEIRKDMEPRINAVRQQSRDRIRALLSKEQLPEFEKMVQESDRAREKWK